MITVDFKRLCPKTGSRILDIGCGHGRHSARASEFEGTLTVASDRCLDDLRRAREVVAFHHDLRGASHGCCEMALSDIHHLPFRDRVFDLVICSEVLEHVDRPATAVTQLVRVLKPGGALALSVPRQWPETLCWQLSEAYGNTPGGHVRIFRSRDLVKRVTAQGLTWTGRHHAHALHAVYWWLKCFKGVERTDSRLVNLWHDFLVWDMMNKPALTRWAERLLNPVMGKSVVLYFQKS